LHIIESVADRFDQVLVIPSGQPWLRSTPPIASGDERLAMCEAALEDLSDELQSKVALTDIEVNRSGPTYAIETINQLRAFFPGDSFTLILGSDAASQFEQWHRAKDLKAIVEILVVRRPGEAKSKFPEVQIKALDISATQVRSLLESREDVSPYISDAVLTYIKERGLYGSK
jgi:nicotinate-nucleotide adenylyltransferase